MRQYWLTMVAVKYYYYDLILCSFNDQNWSFSLLGIIVFCHPLHMYYLTCVMLKPGALNCKIHYDGGV